MNKIILLLSFGLLVLGSSCTKTATGTAGPSGPQGASGANAQGQPSAITGYVNLVDQYGVTDSSFAGLTVSTIKADSPINSVTDQSGKFSLPGLPIGSYDLLFKKDGFDSLKVHVEHSGGNEDKFIGIVDVNEQVTTKILSESLSLVQGSDYFYDSIFTLQILVNIDGPPLSSSTRRDLVFYYSRSNLVNLNQYDIFGNTYGNSLETFNNTYSYSNSLANFLNRGINYHSGDTIYVKTYISPVNHTITSWFNYSTNQTINYPYLGDSSLNYFVWP